MPIRNPRWLPMQDIVLTQNHIGKYRKNLFLKNYWAEWTYSVHEWSLNGLSQFISFREEDLWNFSQSEHIIGPGSHVEYPTGTKNRNFVENHPRNIPAKFGSNWPCGFGEEAWNMKSLDDGYQVMVIVPMDLWSRWTNQRLSRACIVHLVIKKTNWSYVKTMSCVILEYQVNDTGSWEPLVSSPGPKVHGNYYHHLVSVV
jgi:hypothetical protein